MPSPFVSDAGNDFRQIPQILDKRAGRFEPELFGQVPPQPYIAHDILRELGPSVAFGKGHDQLPRYPVILIADAHRAEENAVVRPARDSRRSAAKPWV